MHILVFGPFIIIPVAAVAMAAFDTYLLATGRPKMSLYDVQYITYALAVLATLATIVLAVANYVWDVLVGLFGIFQSMRAIRTKTSAPGRKISDMCREQQHSPAVNTTINLKNTLGHSTLRGAFR